MRVLTITSLYPNPFDPNRAIFNRQQFRALSQLMPVRVISPVSWTEELAGRRRGVALPVDRVTTADGIPVAYPRYYYTPRVLRGSYGRFFLWSIRSAFERIWDEFKPDLILGSWAYPDGWAAVQLAREKGLPTVIKVHGCDVLYGLRNTPARLPGTIEAVRAADGIVSVSRDLARHVREFGVPDDRIRVIYNGVDARLFSPGDRERARGRIGIPGGEALVLFLGGLEPVKGLDILIDACARLRDRGLRFTCRLVGEGRLRRQLTEMITSLDLQGFVRLEGARPHAELPDWLRAADLFVLPSRSEGVPNVLLEAMSCGIPFVASQVGGIPEVAEFGSGRLVPPQDPTALADAIWDQLAAANARGAVASSYARSHEYAATELGDYLEHILSAFEARRRAPAGMRTVA
jgi:glycosyltransferase involved in cell wall biosynthesis